jgi:hypothetical protein
MYAKDQAAAVTALSAARAQLDSDPALDADKRQALAYLLHYMQYRMGKALDGQDEAAAFFPAAVEAIGQSASGPVARAMQCKLLLMLRASGERAGYGALPAAQFRELFDGVPEGDRDQEFWYYAASWAFSNRIAEYLALAYEEFVTHAHGMLSASMFRRVNLMYLLLSHSASRQDIVELICQCRLPQQMQEIRRHIWPVCKEQGLVDEDLERMLTDKETQLSSAAAIIQLPPPANTAMQQP